MKRARQESRKVFCGGQNDSDTLSSRNSQENHGYARGMLTSERLNCFALCSWVTNGHIAHWLSVMSLKGFLYLGSVQLTGASSFLDLVKCTQAIQKFHSSIYSLEVSMVNSLSSNMTFLSTRFHRDSLPTHARTRSSFLWT